MCPIHKGRGTKWAPRPHSSLTSPSPLPCQSTVKWSLAMKGFLPRWPRDCKMAVRGPLPWKATCEWVAAATLRQSLGQQSGGRVRQKRKTKNKKQKKTTAHYHVAKSVARLCLAAFRGPQVNEARGDQEHDNDDGLTLVSLNLQVEHLKRKSVNNR